MIIGYDVDGVGFNFGDSCHRFLIHKGMSHLWKSGPTPDPYWDWYKDWGWDTEEFLQFCNEGADAGFIFSGPVREGYRESILAVREMGHKVVVITDRGFGTTPEVSHDLTYAWFDMHDIPFDELHFSADKTCVPTDMFIEDKLSNYDALVDAGTDAYLINRPWNRDDGDSRKRITHMEQFTAAVRKKTESMV